MRRIGTETVIVTLCQRNHLQDDFGFQLAVDGVGKSVVSRDAKRGSIEQDLLVGADSYFTAIFTRTNAGNPPRSSITVARKSLAMTSNSALGVS